MKFNPTLKDRLLYQFRKLSKPSVVELDDVRIAVFPDLPKGIKRALYRGDYEYEERCLVKSALRKNDRVLEIGTGIGVVATLCSRLVPDGELLCYEANPAVTAKIKKNFELNSVAAELRCKAVAVETGTTKFHFNDNIVSSGIAERENSPEPTLVECDAFKNLIEEFNPTAIVMDIEGAEVDVFANINLEGVRVIVLETHPWIVGQQAVDDLLLDLEHKGLALVAGHLFNDTVLLERVETNR